jgi:transposase-like protein
VLGPQGPQCHERPAEVRPAGRDEGDAGDLQRRRPRARREGDRGVRAHLRRQVPHAVAKITEDREELLAFYDFPAEHWIHLRTTNPIESTFSTVKLRTKVTRGAGSPAAALAMVFKRVESAQARWRAIRGAHLVALVRAGAVFENGVLVEREQTTAA